jgi:hypothetical protein
VPASRQIVVNDIKHLGGNPRPHSGKHNRVGTIVNVGHRYGVRTAEMQKHSKRVDPHSASNGFVAGPIDIPRPYDDMRNPESFTILDHDFVLFDLSETIGVVPERGT